MSEKIKEILGRLDFNEWEVDLYKVPITWSELYDVRDYITNLQKENEEFYQLMEMQNKREYRSKFLKDFQKEHGKNVFPDYDEIYKRYDDYKQRNEKAIEYIDDNLQMNIITGSEYFASYSPCTDLLNILEGGDK